ncbi:MAG: metal-dependent hydrolase [Desulfobacterales bacterium]
MPLPLGHAAIGLATYEASTGTSAFGRWKSFVFIVLLANLPDIDVLIGLLLKWNGSAYHRGPTHSLAFALFGGLLAFHCGRRWLKIAQFGYLRSVLLILSHVVADAVFTDSPVSFFWPFELNWSAGYRNWTDVVHSILFESFRDGWIVLCCILAIVLLRWVRRYTAPPQPLPQIIKKIGPAAPMGSASPGSLAGRRPYRRHPPIGLAPKKGTFKPAGRGKKRICGGQFKDLNLKNMD